MTISVPAGSPVRSRQTGFYAAFLALLVMTAGPVGAQDKDPVVAKVNGIEIHQSDLAVAEVTRDLAVEEPNVFRVEQERGKMEYSKRRMKNVETFQMALKLDTPSDAP